MEDIKRHIAMGHGEMTYIVLEETFSEETADALISLGYKFKVSLFDDSAFLKIIWDSKEERKERMIKGIPQQLHAFYDTF